MKTTLLIFIASTIGLLGAYTITTSDGASANSGEHSVSVIKSNEVVNLDLNIIISPDLSNRITIHKKPLNDLEIFKSVVDLYYPDTYNSNKRLIGQNDKISVLFTNTNLISLYQIKSSPLTIDLNFRTQNLKRINYLEGKLDNMNFEDDKNSLIKEIKSVYSKAENMPQGADIYGLFEDRLGDGKIQIPESSKEIFGKTVIPKKRNILILLTDGYIEAGYYSSPKTGKKYHYLNQALISEFRNAYNKSGYTDLKSFFKDSGYGLVPVNNPELTNLEVLGCEFYDRSINKKNGNTQVRPRDYKIMKVFWEDWMKKSGVKKFEMHERFASKGDFEIAYKSFIEG